MEGFALGHPSENYSTGMWRILSIFMPDYEGPKKHREHCERARNWQHMAWVIDGVLVYVDDIDSHYKQAVAAGATIKISNISNQDL